jgi:hypothetical protein
MSDLAKALKKGNYFDQLNDKGYVRISSLNPEAVFKHNPDTSYTRVKGKGIGKEAAEEAFKVAGKGIGKEAGEDLIKVAGKGVTKLGSALKGSGKLAAIGAGLAAAGGAMAGENPDWKTMGEGAVSALTPMPVDAAMGSLANSESLGPEDYRRLREDRAAPGALEFGNTFNDAMKSGKLQYDGSPRLRAAMMSVKKR